MMMQFCYDHVVRMIILLCLLCREDFVEYKDLECIGLYGSDGVAVQMKSLNIFLSCYRVVTLVG